MHCLAVQRAHSDTDDPCTAKGMRAPICVESAWT